jgi:hypothetical protein
MKCEVLQLDSDLKKVSGYYSHASQYEQLKEYKSVMQILDDTGHEIKVISIQKFQPYDLFIIKHNL